MNREELDRELDEWLDRAAAEYGRAETRPGFEKRVIANLNSRLEKRKWHFRWIPVAAAASAILLFSVYLLRTEFKNRPTSHITSRRPVELKTGPEQTLHKNSTGKVAIPAEKKMARHARSYKPSGRFLSSGLSDQERYLIAFARAAAEQNIAGLYEKHEFEPLQIPEMEIPDFEIPSFEMTSFRIEAVHEPTPGEEEKL